MAHEIKVLLGEGEQEKAVSFAGAGARGREASTAAWDANLATQKKTEHSTDLLNPAFWAFVLLDKLPRIAQPHRKQTSMSIIHKQLSGDTPVCIYDVARSESGYKIHLRTDLGKGATDLSEAELVSYQKRFKDAKTAIRVQERVLAGSKFTDLAPVAGLTLEEVCH